MKKIILFFAFLFFVSGIYAQSLTTTAEYNKTVIGAIENNIPYNPKTVETALKEKMSAYNIKPSNQKGYIAYRGVKMDNISPNIIDVYFKINSKSKRDNNASVITMLLSTGFESFMSEIDNPDAFGAAKEFLNSLVQNAAAADLNQQIKTQGNAVVKADKKLKSLRSELNSLNKKLDQTRKKISDTEKEITRQEDILRKEQAVQQNLESRKTN
ncbi:MAG: hypothetical protein KF829_08560 [Ferruginibacter sp.]|nr:hypothetical protein [Ferruginibacter sp.]